MNYSECRHCRNQATHWIDSPENQFCEPHYKEEMKERSRLEERFGARRSPTRAQKRAALRRLHGKGKLW